MSSGYSGFDIKQITAMHGTRSSTLYFMGKAEGANKNCVIPLARQIGLTFAGELRRGFQNGSCNLNYSFWAPKSALGLSRVESYAQSVGFTFEEGLRQWKSTVKEYDPDKDFSICGEHKQYLSTWEHVDFTIKRMRAFDEGRFQRELKDPLEKFFARVMVDIKSDIEMKKVRVDEGTIEKITRIVQSLQEPATQQLSEEDKEQILHAYPIVFLTQVQVEDFSSSDRNENKMARNMELGKDIPWIATSDRHVLKLKEYLDKTGLFSKVSVISLEAFSALCR